MLKCFKTTRWSTFCINSCTSTGIFRKGDHSTMSTLSQVDPQLNSSLSQVDPQLKSTLSQVDLSVEADGMDYAIRQ